MLLAVAIAVAAAVGASVKAGNPDPPDNSRACDLSGVWVDVFPAHADPNWLRLSLTRWPF